MLVYFKGNKSLSDSVFRDLSLFFSLFLFCSLYLFVLLVSSDGEASAVLEDCKAVVSNFGDRDSVGGQGEGSQNCQSKGSTNTRSLKATRVKQRSQCIYK